MRRGLALALLASVGGCIADGTGPTLYLEFELENLGAERTVGIGPHCGSARYTGDQAQVERGAYSRLGERRPFLIVEPDLVDGPSRFMALGFEGYPLPVPATVLVTIEQTDVALLHVDHVEGRVVVDGSPVDLPHAWSRTEPGDWRAAFRLWPGPDRVELTKAGVCA